MKNIKLLLSKPINSLLEDFEVYYNNEVNSDKMIEASFAKKTSHNISSKIYYNTYKKIFLVNRLINIFDEYDDIFINAFEEIENNLLNTLWREIKIIYRTGNIIQSKIEEKLFFSIAEDSTFLINVHILNYLTFKYNDINLLTLLNDQGAKNLSNIKKNKHKKFFTLPSFLRTNEFIQPEDREFSLIKEKVLKENKEIKLAHRLSLNLDMNTKVFLNSTNEMQSQEKFLEITETYINAYIEILIYALNNLSIKSNILNKSLGPENEFSIVLSKYIVAIKQIKSL